jgi:RNA polymerase sigma-54 factor
MALGPRLDLRQSQSLVMTPQLQQAIKLLALSNLEIEGFLAEELEKNPLLEHDGDAPTPDPDVAESYGGEDEARDAGDPETADRLLIAGDAEGDSPLDVDYREETFHHDSASDSIIDAGQRGMDGGLRLEGPSGAGSGDESRLDFDSVAAGDISLHEHLMRQAGATFSDERLFIARHVIDLIDEAGYLTVGTLELSHRLNMPLAEIEITLSIIQGFDPTGVGARSLAECLALQAREADRYDPAMARLIDNLDLLAKGALPQLKRICGVDGDDLTDMISELRAYNPKPGLRFSTDIAQTVTPDIFVRQTSAGWAVELNSATLPRLLINRSYYVELGSGPQDKLSRAWLSERLASANWLIKALDQRARTIVKVATEILKQQEGFFRDGIEYLRPLTLKTVAEAIGMHESTVSRVTSNKYLSCTRGVFELKFFFTSGVAASDGGDAVSAEAVKSQIRTLIAAEGDDILSDDKLVELLRDKGFDLARRTVAKYREAIGLGSSVQRRRQRAMGARAA